MKTLGALLVLGLFMTGCPTYVAGDDPTQPTGTPPAASPKPKPISEQLRIREAPSKCTDDELKAREKDNKSIVQIIKLDDKLIDTTQKDRWVEKWSDWSFYGGFIGLGGGIIAAFLIIWFLKNVKMGLSIGGALVGLGAISFLFAQVIAHWQAVVLTCVIIGAIAIGIAIYAIIKGKVDDLKEGVRLFSSKVKDIGGDLKDELAHSATHNVDSLQKLVDEAKG